MRSDLARAQYEAKDAIQRRNARNEEEGSGAGQPEVADIVNGTATGKPLPYQVGLTTNPGWSLECGGSLIASRVVLTAAHCYINKFGEFREPALRIVQVNMYNASNPDGVTFINLNSGKIGRDIFTHPHYNPATFANDVALLILPVGLEEGDNIKYAKLNNDPNVPAADERLYASGWGKIEEGGPSSDILLGTVVNYVPDDKCYKMWCDQNDDCPPMNATDGMMCAHTKGTDACDADSGGPLVIASKNENSPATEPPRQKSASYLLEMIVRSREFLEFTLV